MAYRRTARRGRKVSRRNRRNTKRRQNRRSRGGFSNDTIKTYVNGVMDKKKVTIKNDDGEDLVIDGASLNEKINIDLLLGMAEGGIYKMISENQEEIENILKNKEEIENILKNKEEVDKFMAGVEATKEDGSLQVSVE
tara:strand:- start:317 stop:730 length:414 start_codon:yes stop_codon:yes gene_type:complete